MSAGEITVIPTYVMEFNRDLAAAQGKFQGIDKNRTADGGNSFSYEYFDLAALILGTKEVLAEYGLSVRFTMHPIDGVVHELVCTLSHKGGHSVFSAIRFAFDLKPQQTGMRISYYKRYLMGAMLNVTDSGDNDAAGASEPHKANKNTTAPKAKEAPTQDPAIISDAQRKRLFAISSKLGVSDASMKEILGTYGYESSKDIKKADYEKIVSECEARGNVPA